MTVNKDAIPDDGQDFSYTTTGGFNPATFSLDDDADEGTLPSPSSFTFTGADFDAGDETITEDGETGWTLTDLICTGDDDYQESGSTATLNVEPGETIVCDYENTKDATVTVNKDAIPDDAQDFSFTTTGGFNPGDLRASTTTPTARSRTPRSFTFSGADFDAGDETITETGETGWTLTALTCTGDDDYQESGSTATLNVEPGETIVCDYENTKDATVTVNKDAIPNDAQDFSFTTTGGFNPGDLRASTTTPTARSSNTQELHLLRRRLRRRRRDDHRDGETGWTLTALTCTGDDDYQESGSTATLNVEPGETIVCDYENTKDATVTVNKDAIPNDAQDFSFTTTGGFNPVDLRARRRRRRRHAPRTPRSFTFSGADFDAGDETITEDGETGWTLSDLNCTGDDDYQESGSTATLNVEPGETIVCDYENTAASGVAPETGGGSRDVDANIRDPVEDGSGKFPRGRLPFTGLALGLLVLVAIALLTAGPALRRRTRD